MSGDTLNNEGTHFIAGFAPLYAVLAIMMIIIHYLRVHAIEPVIDFHVNRRGVMDFSALLDAQIERIINSTLPASEQLIWADVSLKISRWRHLLISISCLVIGGVALSILPHTPAVSPFLLPLFILLTLPSFYLIGSGLHQLIKKKNYTHIYMLTTSGAIIVYSGLFGRKQIFQWPYKCMVNIHAVHVMYKVASLYFAENWDIAVVPNDRLLQDGQGNKDIPFKWKHSKVGFENIVKANEVEDLIRQQVTQLSPSSSRHVAYTL
eukprot:Phypoly_transcript_15155.p1 GENE.Phypoly_transcript_15155~~Phypoly_transcript_15155.p1  ORF type:complete len:296 (+),score=20.14 Phypoly_transcript_15155:98-889(+)